MHYGDEVAENAHWAGINKFHGIAWYQCAADFRAG